jgi:hypothetical protein
MKMYRRGSDQEAAKERGGGRRVAQYLFISFFFFSCDLQGDLHHHDLLRIHDLL